MINTEEWIKDRGLRNEILIGSRTKPIYLDALLEEFKTDLVKKLTIPVVIQQSELVCMCKETTQVNRINDRYICCTCNSPLM